MLKYNVPYFEQGDVEAFLTSLARVNQRVNKFGEPNHDGAARILLRDWAASQFPYYTMPPKATMEVEVAVKQPDMSAVLAQVPTRKELRKARGIIKFEPSELDTREIFLDDDYTDIQPERSHGDDDEDDDEEEEEDELDDEDEEEDELDDEEEGAFIGSDEGSEVELEDGSEPSSGSDVEEEEEDESESEEEIAPPSRKRKAPGPAPVVRKKAKTVQFPAKLEAPRSRPKGVVELRPILKQPKSVLKAAASAEKAEKTKKSAKIAAAPAKDKSEMTKEERRAAARAKLEAKKAEKAALKAAGLLKPKSAPAPEPPKKEKAKKSKADKQKAKNSAAPDANGAAYDWRQHF